ncbi:MAG: InlB B-repeat-containing protein, partial [Microcella sp.]|nr:InlB B-repeat-containing protein [Microcella sp.]
TVAASGGHMASGIGGGSSAIGGTTIITGGTVTATGNVSAGAGIGSGGGGSIDVAVGPITTISGGTVIAQGGSSGAGIGGGSDRPGGTTTISGGTVTALGGYAAAGIGGGGRASGGATTISGGTVSVTGGENGSGIGSGASTVFNGQNGGTVSLTGGVVTVTGGYQAAAIGGGTNATGGSVTIGADGDVTATGGTPMSAIGGGLFSTVFGSLDVSGRLTIPSGAKLTIPTGATATVTSTGTIAGGGAVNGAGAIVNGGSITNTAVTNLADTPGGLTITVNDYLVTFDGNHAGAAAIDPVRVYAATFDDGERSIPTPTRAGYVIAEWNTAADGSGTELTATTTLSADQTAYAQWALAGYTIAPASATVTAGDDEQFTVTRAINFGSEDATDEFTFSSSTASAEIGAGGLVGFTEAGDRTITATLIADDSVTVEATITVDADAANPVVSLTPATGSVTPGDSLTFTVTVTDPHGNPIDGAADDVVLTSDEVTDVVVDRTITFTAEGERVITASFDGASDTATVTVQAVNGDGAGGDSEAGDGLAATGSAPSAPLVIGSLFAMLAGLALLAARRRVGAA